MRYIITLKFQFFILLLTCSHLLQAQSFDTVLNKLDTEYPQEKIYIHFDRQAYNAGETIWFKAYVFSGNFLSLVSKNIYTELSDLQGKVLQRKVMPLLFSTAASSFDIPEEFNGSAVYVRAYTKWMLNFDSSFLFQKSISILNTKQTTNKTVPVLQKNNKPAAISKTPQSYLQFFPESGDMAEGVESIIAFKATDKKGMPVKVNGDILDSKRKKIVSFASVHDGMGKFILRPQINEDYKAVYKDHLGNITKTALPRARKIGVMLEANTVGNDIEVKIKRSQSANYPFVYLVAQMNQQHLYTAKVRLNNPVSSSIIIPTATLPSGIVQLTIFTHEQLPLAERIIFVNPATSTFITDLNLPLKNLVKRKRNVIQIDVPDTIATNLSISVTDEDLNPVEFTDNIFSHILLTSDIKGYVHNPAYYFSSEADSVADHLDLVMLTNGWRRFKWEEALSGNFPKLKYNPEEYLTIEGQVHGLNKTQMANKEINAVIQLKNGNNHFVNMPLLANGTFNLPGMIFYDTAKFYYQFNDDKNQSLASKASFTVTNNLFKEKLSNLPLTRLLFDLPPPDPAVFVKNKEIYQEQLKQNELDKVKILSEVSVTTRKKSNAESLENQYTSGLFSGGNGRTYVPGEETGIIMSKPILEYLQMILPGLQVNNKGFDISLQIRRSNADVYINEWKGEANELKNYNVGDVAMIKVYDHFLGSSGGASPAIAVYLKKGYNKVETKGLGHTNIAGYSPHKEFYSPDHSKPDSSSSPDYRTTLYWNPFVITGKHNRRISLPFYNNDISKKIRVIIEGCNAEGKLTRIEKVFQ